MNTNPVQPSAAAAIHVDLDGARHIYRAHGWRYDWADDPLFESGLRAALDFFEREQVTATLFVIAEDLLDPRKRVLLDEAVRAGHEIASHSVTHQRLTLLSREAKRREIFESRSRLMDAFGVEVTGFRAPGFHSDVECLELIGEAGYAYDASMLDGRDRRRHGPHPPLLDNPLIELPVPSAGPFALPFHPSYSLVIGSWYFRAGLESYRRRGAAFVLLFHLTDFADPLPRTRTRGCQQRIFTLSHLPGDRKRARSAAMLERVRRSFLIVSTTSLLLDAGL